MVLDCPKIPDEEHHPILREEVEAAVKALKMGKSAGVDNIPAELVHAGGEAMIYILTTICNKILKTGEWSTTWTSRRDHCRRVSGCQSRKEQSRTNIQSQDPRGEIPAVSAESLPCLHRLQEGL